MQSRLAKLFFATIIGSMLGQSAIAGPFVNLDIEDSPLLPSSSPSLSVPVSQLFPGWTLLFNENVQANASFNDTLLVGPAAVLWASDAPDLDVVEGTKSIALAGWDNNTSASISQTGDVPVGSQSIRFLARNVQFSALPIPPGPLFLTMNGLDVPLVILSSSGNGDFVFGGDVTTWAGTTSDLRLGGDIPKSCGWPRQFKRRVWFHP